MGSPSHLQRLHALFDEASDLTPKERKAFVDEHCQDNEALRAELESLLEVSDSDVLKEPSINSEQAFLAPLELCEGDMVGKYRLLERIGDGAHAVVWMVEQVELLRRRAAMKVIKLGMDTKEVIARFDVERQALAMMDHPNIAKVLDAGATDTGRPYFVMELVKGIPITDYCDRNHLSTRERLDLFILVCQALQHAHLKGLIHRDIKPSNILVTLHDGTPVPKVIDFGIAKATESRLTDRTLFTRFHQFIGTPAYMSPEQAEMSGLDIDSRSDVYSLGVLLYELLAGSTPFDGRELLDAGYSELQRVIRDEEPPKPSTRLSTLSQEGLTAMAKNRSIESGELGNTLDGDLDWIVMKALEKDRTRRYETAADLARDVRRHLADEPVEAGPPRKLYRFSKFARRHRPAVIAAGAAFLSLIAAIMIGSFGLLRATHEAKVASRQAEKASAVTSLLNAMFRAASPEASKGRDFTVRQLLDDFSLTLDRQLDQEPEVEMTVHTTVGEAYEGLGHYLKAERHLRRARELAVELHGERSPKAALSLAQMGWLTFRIGSADAARRQLNEAARMQRELLGDNHPHTLQSIGYLAAVESKRNQLDVAESYAQEVLQASAHQDVPNEAWVKETLAEIYRRQGRHEDAVALGNVQVPITDAIAGGDQATTLEALRAAARNHIDNEAFAKARPIVEKGLPIARRTLSETHRITLGFLSDQAILDWQAGHREAARLKMAQVIEQQSQTIGPEQGDTIRSILAAARMHLEDEEIPIATDMAQEAYEYALGSSGDSSETTISTVCELISVLIRDDSINRASSMLERYQRLARRHLEPTHPLVQKLQLLQGELYERDVLLLEAERVYLNLMIQCEDKLGPDNSDTLRAMEALARTRLTIGKYGESVEALELLVQRSFRAFGEDHERTYAAQDMLVRALEKCGRWQRAVEIGQTAYASAVRTYTEAHPTCYDLSRRLAETYASAGDLYQSLALLEPTVASATNLLGVQHPKTRLYHGNRDHVLNRIELDEQREETLKAEYEAAERRYGVTHRVALEKRSLWTDSLSYLNNREEETAVQVAAYLKDVREAYPADHIEVFKARLREAMVAAAAFDYDTADVLFRRLIADKCRVSLKLDYELNAMIFQYAKMLHGLDRGDEMDALIDEWQDTLVKDAQWESDRTLTLLDRGSQWRFTFRNTDEGTIWREPGDEAITDRFGKAWGVGKAPFGREFRGLMTIPARKHWDPINLTHYFRKNIEVDDPGRFQALKIRLRRDDAAAVYINGQRVVKSKLPEGFTFDTPATEATRACSLYAAYVYLVEPSVLQDGVNTIAVEVHQARLADRDMAFDLQIQALLNDDPTQ